MKNKILTVVFVIIVIVAIFLGYKLFQRVVSNPDSAAKQAADIYLINLLGESEFRQNYIFDYKNSEDCQKEDQFGGCYLRYKFLPAEKYGGSEFLLFYSFADKKVSIANNGVTLFLPSCEKDKNKCAFDMSLKDLQEIARQENLDDRYFRLIFYNDEIVAEAGYCNLETMGNRNKIYVSLQDGAILWRGVNSECQGII